MSIKNFSRYIIIFVTGLVGFATSGCVDDFDNSLTPSVTPRYLSLKNADGSGSAEIWQNLNGEGFSKQVEVESQSTPWAFVAKPNWISIEPSSGIGSGVATITGVANESGYDSRSGMVVLSSQDPQWNFERRLQVSQKTATPWVEISEDNCKLQLSGASFERIIPVKSNCYWRVSKPSNASWLSVTDNGSSKGGQGGYISISASYNNSGSARSTTLDVYAENGARLKVISITQNPPEVSLSQTHLYAVNGASKCQLSIDSELPWTAVPDQPWIKVTPSEGNAGTTKIEVEIAENNSVSVRSGIIYFRHILAGNSYVDLTSLAIQQDRVYLEVENGGTCKFNPQGSSTNIKLRSNTNWSVSSLPAWVTVSALNGVGNTDLTITASENLTNSKRSGSIVFSKPGVSLSYTLNVEQDCPTLSPSVTQMEFGDRASWQEFDITSNVNWTSSIRATGGWLSTNVSTGSGDSKVVASVTENNSTFIRTGAINYTWSSGSSSVEVRQQPKYLSVSDETLNFSSTGGNHLLSVTTNDRWTLTAEGSPDWITLSKTSGSGQDNVSINIADNPTINPRSARVILNTENSGGAVLIINQRPRFLELSMSSVYMYQTGGVSSPFVVSTDGTYSIAASHTWFRVENVPEQGPNVYQVKIDSNPGKTTRRGTLRFSLTGLREGFYSVTMSIVQADNKTSFVLDGFSEDIDWNEKPPVYFSTSEFGSDTDWSQATRSNNTLMQSNGSNSNLNSNKQGIRLDVKRYSIDTSWKEGKQDELSISIKGFSTDNDPCREDPNNSSVMLLRYGAKVNSIGQPDAVSKMIKYGANKGGGNN